MKYDESTKYYSYADEDQDLWLLLTHARYVIFRSREKELQRYGISPEQTSVLFIVQALGQKATPAEISRFILRQPHTVSALVDRMAKKGLVLKVKDLERKNLVRVALTEKGIKAYNYSTKRTSVHRIMDTLTRKEHEQLKGILEKLLNAGRKELGMDKEEMLPEY